MDDRDGGGASDGVGGRRRSGPRDHLRRKGGPEALARALERAARSFGSDVRTGSDVVEITTREGRASGVVLDSGEVLSARVVVSAADPKRTLKLLVPTAAGPTLLWRDEAHSSRS